MKTGTREYAAEQGSPAPLIVTRHWRMRGLSTILLVSFALLGCGRDARSERRLDKASEELTKATTDRDRYYALTKAAKESFVQGKTEDARKYATELSLLAPKFQDDWNYGNAIHHANLVLGRIAVSEGRIDDAKKHLLEAAKSQGSPQMNSFGPNMSLAKDLLEKNEREVVLQYFELCRKFWRMEDGRLDQWTGEVKSGKIPDFGANLVY